MGTYKDATVECTDHEVRIRWYYPWGAKRIPYGSIRSMTRFELTPLRGKYRIWGTGTFQYWANFDPRRPKKSVGVYLECGRRIRPLVTPDDPDQFETVVNEHIGERSP